MYGPAILVNTYYSNSQYTRTIVHITYYMANADGWPAEKAAAHTAVQYAKANYFLTFAPVHDFHQIT